MAKKPTILDFFYSLNASITGAALLRPAPERREID
jgi:hypothetical protein